MPSDKDLPQNDQTLEELQSELDDFDGTTANDANEVADTEDEASESKSESESASTDETPSEAAPAEDQSAGEIAEPGEADEPADDADTSAKDTAAAVAGDSIEDFKRQLQELQEQKLALMERVNELAGAAVFPQATSVPKFEPKPLDVELSESDFVEAMQSAEGMKKVLIRIAAQARESAVEEARERMRMELPVLANDVWKAQNYVKTMLEGFYSQNPDLKPVRQFVASVLTNIECENPGLSHAELLDRAGKRTRELLKIQQQALEAANKEKRKPAFATQKGAAKRGKPKSEVSNLQKELDEL